MQLLRIANNLTNAGETIEATEKIFLEGLLSEFVHVLYRIAMQQQISRYYVSRSGELCLMVFPLEYPPIIFRVEGIDDNCEFVLERIEDA